VSIADNTVSIEDLPDREICYLNLSRLIKHYISPFFKLEPQTALQYSYLVALGADIPGGSGEKQRQLALELVRDIVLASRSWSKLLGSVRADGSKQVRPWFPFLEGSVRVWFTHFSLARSSGIYSYSDYPTKETTSELSCSPPRTNRRLTPLYQTLSSYTT
jgi:hypothetical protein